MAQYMSAITTVSSKGQLVLPLNIRNGMNIKPGIKMFVLSDGESIILKPIAQPDISEFRSLMDAAKEWASDVRLTEDDINDAIKTVRAKRKVTV